MICPVCEHEVTVSDGRVGLHGDCPGGLALVDLAAGTLESRYTPPRPDCPNPERWHSADWDSAEIEVTALVAAFVRALRPNVVVETGSAFGQTAAAIGQVLAEAGVGVLHTVELDPERAAATRTRCDGLPVKVEEMASLDFEPPQGVDFAWFDSLLDLRVPEFLQYHDRFSPGAIVGFHDVGPQFPLWSEIAKLEEEGLLLPMRLRTPRGVCFGEVA
jgi:hypothetical protein